MSKSYWLKGQTGNFSNAKEDTFDPRKRYVGIRLQQGVPLLDRDWNELEDIRRYEDLMLRRWYLGNGTPDNGFEISQDDSAADDFRIGTGRCMVDGFEAVNEPDKDGYRLYSEQKDLAALTIPPEGDRVGTVYLDAWIEEITGAEDHALKNSNDLNVETCVRHKVEWRVRVAEEGTGYDNDEYHHYYDLAEITWKDGKIIGVEDLRITNLTLASVSSVRDELEYARKGTVNRWIKGGEVECERSGDGYGFIIGEMRCIMGGRVIKFVRAEKSEEIKEGENCVILARTSGADIRPEIEFIVTRSNLLEWLNDWTSEKWMPAGYTEPVLKSTFTLPLYFFERPSKDENLKKRDLRHHGVLDRWLAELADKLDMVDADERRRYKVPLLRQTVFGEDVPSIPPIGVGLNPYDVAFDGAHIWVSNAKGGDVSKIDIATDKKEDVITGGQSPCGVAFDGKHIWVANRGSDSVGKIDITTNKVLKRVSIGGGTNPNPYGVAFDGTHIWASIENNDSVSKINITTNEVEDIVHVGNAPRGVAFDGTHIWVANNGDSTVSKIDITTDDVVATISVGNAPHGVAFDGTHIWITNTDSNSVSKIDIATNKVAATVPVGNAPHGIAFDGTHIWVANKKSDTVSKIDITTNEVEDPVPVGNKPHGVAFDGTHIWVANNGDSTVNKIPIWRGLR